MDIFNGIEILFFFLGLFTACSIMGLLYLKIKFNAGPKNLIISALGIFLLLFNMAWSLSSILENEHQAANMGMLFFGLPGVLLLGMAWKMLQKDRIKALENQEKQ